MPEDAVWIQTLSSVDSTNADFWNRCKTSTFGNEWRPGGRQQLRIRAGMTSLYNLADAAPIGKTRTSSSSFRSFCLARERVGFHRIPPSLTSTSSSQSCSESVDLFRSSSSPDKRPRTCRTSSGTCCVIKQQRQQQKGLNRTRSVYCLRHGCPRGVSVARCRRGPGGLRVRIRNW